MIRTLLDLGTLSALVNAVAALGCIWTMQSVTAEAGFATPGRVVKLFHRIAYGFLALVLFANASETLSDDSDPRMIDFVAQCSFLCVVAVSVVRHRMARPVVIVQDETGMITKIVDHPSKEVKSMLTEGETLPRNVLVQKGESLSPLQQRRKEAGN